MERLTQRLRTGEVLMASEYEEKYTEQEWISVLQDRLAAYEDTGLTPERCAEFARADAGERYIVMRDAEQEGVARLRELAEADMDGRVLVLPCKVGDTVYFRTYDCNGKVDLGIQPHKVTAIVGSAIVRGGYIDIGLLLGQYGVSWFLTREEAESALEAMDDGNG